MMRMWEHIDGSDVGDTISWQFLGFFIASFSGENFEITSKGCRIARDIDDFSSSEREE